MKRDYLPGGLLRLLGILPLALLAVWGYGQTTYTWTGSAGSAWGSPANWNPAGVPGPLDRIVVPGALNPPELDMSRTVDRLTVSGGTLLLQGNTLTCVGDVLINGSATIGPGVLQLNNPAGTSNLGPAVIQADINGTSGQFKFQDIDALGTVSITKTTSGTGTMTGDNTFHGTFRFHLAAGHMELARTGATDFLGDVLLESSGTGRVSFGMAGGLARIAAGHTVQAHAATYATGELRLEGITFLGPDAQNLELGADATFVQGPGATFHGPLIVEAGHILLNGGLAMQNARYTKTAAVSDNGKGGGVYHGTLELCNKSTSSFRVAMDQPDVYNGNLVVRNDATGNIQVGGNNGSATLTPGRLLIIPPGEFEQGSLILYNFIQAGGTPQVIALGTLATLQIGAGCSFAANLDLTAGSIYLNGGTFNGAYSRFTKTGIPPSDHCTGGNVYNGTTEFVHMGTGGWHIAYDGSDKFLGDVRVSSVNGGHLSFGYNTGLAFLADGYTISVGSLGFQNSRLTLGEFIQEGHTPQVLDLSNTGTLALDGSTFNASLTTYSQWLTIGNSTFNGECHFTRDGPAPSDHFGGGNTYNRDTEFTLIGTGSMWVGRNGVDHFNADVRVNSSSTATLCLGHADGGIVLAAGHTLTVGSTGFTSGELRLTNFVQLGNTPQLLHLDAASLRIAAGTVFNAEVDLLAAHLYLDGGTFHQDSRFTKTGDGATDQCEGGNVYHGVAGFTHTGSGAWALARNGDDLFLNDILVNSIGTGETRFSVGSDIVGSTTLANGRTISVGALGFNSGTLRLGRFEQVGATPQMLNLEPAASLVMGPNTLMHGALDANAGHIYLHGGEYFSPCHFRKTGTGNDDSQGGNIFHADVEFVNQASGAFRLCHTGHDLFEENVQVGSTGTGYISFGRSSTGSALLRTGKTITVGSYGYELGELYLARFTQEGPTPQHIILGTGATLTLYDNTIFHGPLETKSGRLTVRGSTFHDQADFTKTAGTSDDSYGGNVFHGLARFSNHGTGTLNLARYAVDSLNNDVEVNNTDVGSVNFGVNAGGGAVLADGHTLTVGSEGFTGGQLLLRRFLQLGPTAQHLVLGDNARLNIGIENEFHGNLTTSSGGLYLDGSVFHGSCRFTKTGTTTENCQGNNIFHGPVKVLHAGTGPLHLNRYALDTFLGDLVVDALATGTLSFGVSNGGGAVLADGRTISVGPNGFSQGILRLRGFVQQGNTPQVLYLGNDASLYLETGTEFHGTLEATSGRLWLDGGIFHSPSRFHKTSAVSNNCAGGNQFLADVLIRTDGAWNLGWSAADIFLGDAHFQRLGAGSFYAQRGYDAQFMRDVSTMGSTGPVLFGTANGLTLFMGAADQHFHSDPGIAPVINNLSMATSGSASLILDGNVEVARMVNFGSGVIHPTAVSSTGDGLLILGGSCTVGTAAHDGSHVDGFVRKIGKAAFTYPVGNAGIYAPVSLDELGKTTDHFTAKYVHEDPDGTYPLQYHSPMFQRLSRCEYWIVDRTGGNSATPVTLSFSNGRSCGITAPTDLVVAHWDGSMWLDEGNGGTTGTAANGTVRSAGSISSFSPFTLGSLSTDNPLPIELLSFDAVAEGGAVRTFWRTASEKDNDHFLVERSPDGLNFEAIGRVEGAGNSQQVLSYEYVDGSPLNGLSYYRLRQVDHNGQWSLGNIVPVYLGMGSDSPLLWPNPVADVLHWRLGAGGALTSLEVYDGSGRLLQATTQGGLHEMGSLFLGDAPSGLLLVRMQLADGTWLDRRVVKQ